MVDATFENLRKLRECAPESPEYYWKGSGSYHVSDEAREFYQAARETIPDLLDEIEKLRAEASAASSAVTAGLEALLRRHWVDFSDADPVPDGFIESMEQAGFAEFVEVTKDALSESFATERGIEPGGMMWQLTVKGLEAFHRSANSEEIAHV